MNNKSRAFILTEILTGMMLQAGFIIILCGAFYMTINFYTRTTKILAAREKGQRVISFLDEKVRHAGLGLWRCSNSSNIRSLMNQVTGLQDLENLPVSINKFNNITLSNWASTFTDSAKADKVGDIISGNILTLLYTEKVRSKIIAINTKKYLPGKLEKSQNNEFYFVTTNNSKKYYIDEFNELGTANDINSWAVTPTAGVPLLLKEGTSRDVNISTNIDIAVMSIDIASGAELFKLKCERFFVENDDNLGTGRNFAYFEFRNTWDRNTSNKKNNYEPGILEIYCELDTGNNILNFYVLASGGYDSSINHEKPDSWPYNANWEEDYRHHYVYVSRKSWKLNNISWASTGWN
ncbi:MAG: hypothetical protein IJS99_09555 [Synergistaceae bacterium]|nr:hypothetical protein [Synergistaceae bacterium]